jgi:cytochrome P450
MPRPLSNAPIFPFPLPLGEDPHPRVRALREASPVAITSQGMVVAMRARHLDIVLGDATRQVETDFLALQGVTEGPLIDGRRASLLFSNGDVHRRRRQPLVKTFAFALMEGLRPSTATVADRLVSERLGGGAFDFLDQVASYVPARIIGGILGIPESDMAYLQRLVEGASASLSTFTPQARRELEANHLEFGAYVQSLLDRARRNPKDDFLSNFVSVVDAAGTLSEMEIVSAIVILITAGSDTSRSAIAATLSLLLQHPQEWSKFIANPDAMKKGAVAEGLRCEPVASGLPRYSVRDFELDGYLVPAERVVAFSILSACRDPEIYARPDVFDISRTDHPRWHMAFGGGAHRCLGEALARIEIEETLAAIARLAPRTRLEGPLPRLNNEAIRNVDQMRVSFH